MNGARHRFALGLTCFFDLPYSGLSFLALYTKRIYNGVAGMVYRNSNGHHDPSMVSYLVYSGDIIEEVMAKRYLLNQKQQGAESSWGFSSDTDTSALTPKDRFYQTFSELDQVSFEAFLKDNPEYLENGYDHIKFDFIGDPTQKIIIPALRQSRGILCWLSTPNMVS